MFRNLLLVLFLTALSTVAIAQDTAKLKPADTLKAKKRDTLFRVKPHQMKISFDELGLMLGYQKSLDSLNALHLDAGLVPNTLFAGNYDFNEGQFFGPSFSVNALVVLGYRHYYHFKARRLKKRCTDNNASNYIFVDAGYMGKPVKAASYAKPEAMLLGKFGWGLQRNLGRHFNYEFQAGAMLLKDTRLVSVGTIDVVETNPQGTRAYGYRRNNGLQAFPLLNFSIGYVIF